MGELINSRIIIGEESTRRKEISQIRGSLAILWPENGLCLALNMVTEWPENFLFPVMNIEVCFFIFLNIHLFHSVPSPSSTSELSPWCLDNWSSCLTFPPASLTVSPPLCPLHHCWINEHYCDLVILLLKILQ